MAPVIDLLACVAWWALLAGFAVLASLLTVAVFFHAFPEGGDDAE